MEHWAKRDRERSAEKSHRLPINPCDEIPHQMAVFTRNLNAIVLCTKRRIDAIKGNNEAVRKAHDDGVRDINRETIRSATAVAKLFGVSVSEVLQVLNGVYTPATQCIGPVGPQASNLIKSLTTELDKYEAKNLLKMKCFKI